MDGNQNDNLPEGLPPQPRQVQPVVPRAPVNYQPAEPGWWLATDGNWYPPETPRPAAAPAPMIANPGAGSQNMSVVIQQPGPIGVPKSKVAAGLLGIFLGSLGVHRFYLGHTGLGVLMLLLTLFSFGFLAPFVGLWGFIEGIVILAGGIKTDSNGVPLV